MSFETIRTLYNVRGAEVKHIISKQLPPLDERATQQAVEDALLEALLYKLSDFDRREAKTTASYQERFHGPTNQTSDSTADIALHNVAEETRRARHIERVERAVSRLKRLQRQIIKERYLTEMGITDTVVYLEILGISKGTYYTHRNEALYTLAFFLGVYVEK